ncbi:hypothetical protein EKN06_10115 [Croceicoccus ponticola]|uniref:Ferric reductase like transmembrane component n=1 Tax=Croceicoccus ponticola TaxID=2217664 RepID=A0A437GWQ9_9SPHN|nr:hypothetical protein [Croceicoccus ponticola]RVQ66381.1 hypothetical protein EKN06_10115 [Croceicoccus ponticola]
MASRQASPTQLRDRGIAGHEGFLSHARHRWLKRAIMLAVASFAGYFMADVDPRPNGGSWYGYLLGTTATVLIVWLALLGIRKRSFTPGAWSLKAWTSAHVYLGLALVVVATLHTGFQLGWNVHTLAYGLMMLVIVSGIYGTVVYVTLPRALSSNRKELTEREMLAGLRAADRQIREAAQPLPQDLASIVLAALQQDPFSRSIVRRLSGRYPACATQAALDGLETAAPDDPVVERIQGLLVRRKALLAQMRRHIRLKAMLEVWLYVHVPATVALLAALTAHIVSVFYYW